MSHNNASSQQKQQQQLKDEWLNWDDDFDDDETASSSSSSSSSSTVSDAIATTTTTDTDSNASQQQDNGSSFGIDSGASRQQDPNQPTKQQQDPTPPSSSSEISQMSRDVFEISDYTLRTPFEHFTAEMGKKLRMVDFQEVALGSRDDETVTASGRRRNDANNASAEKRKQEPLFEIDYRGIRLQFYALPLLRTQQQQQKSAKGTNVPHQFPTAKNPHHLAHYFSLFDDLVKQSDIPPVYLLMRPKSDWSAEEDEGYFDVAIGRDASISSRPSSNGMASKLRKSLVKDILSAWRCCVAQCLLQKNRSKADGQDSTSVDDGDAVPDSEQNSPSTTSVSTTSVLPKWVHLPFFCPSGAHFQYHGVQYLPSQNGEFRKFKSELFNQQSEQWSMRKNRRRTTKKHKRTSSTSSEGAQNDREVSQLQQKYRHISSWMNLFPYACMHKHVPLSEFATDFGMDYHVQLTYEIENDLLYWGDILGHEKMRLDNMEKRFVKNQQKEEADTEEQLSDDTSNDSTTRPLPFLNFGTLNHPLDIVFCSAQWNHKTLDSVNTLLNDSASMIDAESQLFQVKEVNGWCVRTQIRTGSECELSNTLHWFKDMIFAAKTDMASEKEHNRMLENQESSTRNTQHQEATQSFTQDASSTEKTANPENTMHMMQSAFQSISPYLSAERPLTETETKNMQALLLNQVFGVRLNRLASGITFKKMNPSTSSPDEKSTSPRKFSPKTFPLNSILALLSMQAAHLEEYVQIKYLWKIFLMALRECWERQQPIPNIFETTPNWDHSILHQKIVLLNCCIEKAIEEEAKRDLLSLDDTGDESEQDGMSVKIDKAATPAPVPLTPTSSTDSDDEFVDAQSDYSDTSQQDEQSMEEKLEAYEASRRGASHSLSPECNLKHIAAPIMVPITQEAPPQTEDKIAEQQKLFAKLGTSKEASQIRQSMQAESLKSDMCAFKAANPDCCFEDFLRWYSPRDISQDSDEMSTRMNHKNMWQEIWQSAESKPALEQKSLFNYEREAELVLHFLETYPMDSLMREVLVFLFVNGFVALLSAVEDYLPHVEYVNQEVLRLRAHMVQVISNPNTAPERYESLCRHFEKIELLVSTFLSLTHQLECPDVDDIPEDLKSFVFQMLNGLCSENQYTFHTHNNEEHEKIREKVSRFISEKFQLTASESQEAAHREYVLQNKSSPSDHQMRITLSSNQLRVSTIFS